MSEPTAPSRLSVYLANNKTPIRQMRAGLFSRRIASRASSHYQARSRKHHSSTYGFCSRGADGRIRTAGLLFTNKTAAGPS